MKQVINGRLYDTDTAAKIGTHKKKHNETLFQKKNGEFFILSEEDEDNSEIFPLATNDAQEWVGKNLPIEKYEEMFGEVDEGGAHIHMCISLTPDIAEVIKFRAGKAGVSVSTYIEKMITYFLPSQSTSLKKSPPSNS